MKTHRHTSLHTLMTSAGTSPVASAGRWELASLGLRAVRHLASLVDGTASWPGVGASGTGLGQRLQGEPTAPTTTFCILTLPPSPEPHQSPPSPGIELPSQAWEVLTSTSQT